MELIATVLLTALILGSLLWVLNRTRVPGYRPTRDQVEKLLTDVIAGVATQQAWDLFISYPVLHDPELEIIRRHCVVVAEGDEETAPYPSGIGGYIFNRAGRERLAEILAELQQLIEDEPYQQEF